MLISDGEHGKGALSEAIFKCHYQIAFFLIEHSANLNVIYNSNGYTPIHYAIENKHYALVERLIQAGANIDLKSSTYGQKLPCLLEFAKQKGTKKIVQLIKETIDSKFKPLSNTNSSQQLLKAVVLYEDSASYNNAVMNNIDTQDEESTLTLLDQERSFTWKVDELIEKKGHAKNSNQTGAKTLLMAAAEKGFDRVVEKLLQCKAKVDNRNPSAKTALHFAAINGHHKVIAVLLQYNADVFKRVTSNHFHALHFAIKEGRNVESVKLLLDKYPENFAELINTPGYKTKLGETFLSLAQRPPQNPDIIKLIELKINKKPLVLPPRIVTHSNNNMQQPKISNAHPTQPFFNITPIAIPTFTQGKISEPPLKKRRLQD